MKPSILGVLSLLALAPVLAGCITPQASPSQSPAGGVGDWTAPAVPKIDAKTFLANHAKFVTTYNYRANNAPGHVGARDYIEKQFKDAGLEVYRFKFTMGIPQEDVCAVKLGVGAPRQWVVVGGHYDTTTTDDRSTQGKGDSSVSQGAYDDGSGTWITVELAKAYAKTPTYYSALLCAFDGEERGLQGSKAMFQSMVINDTFPYPIDGTRAMLDFDMFGIMWPTHAPTYFDSNDKVLNAKVDEFRKALGIPDPMFKHQGITLGKSDYANWYSYKDEHFPTAFYISDFEEVAAPVPMDPGVPPAKQSYPRWHNTDTVETMTVMAGSQQLLEQGFQNALVLGAETFDLMANHPEIPFEPSTPSA